MVLILRCVLRGDAVDNAANLLVNWGWPCQRDSRTYECLFELTMLLARNQYARSEIVRTALGDSIGRNGDCGQGQPIWQSDEISRATWIAAG